MQVGECDGDLGVSKLSVIIAFKNSENLNVNLRLRWRERIVKENPDVEFIAVDDGSIDGSVVKGICENIGMTYVRLQTQDAPFSLARARNAGLRASSREYVYFEDVDFLHKSDFYARLVGLAESNIFDEIPFNFLSVPTLFLTKEASESLLNAPDRDKQFDKYIGALPFLNPDAQNELVDSYALVGSNIFLRRATCFHAGLFDEYFNSWGGEDRDFVFRLLFQNSKLIRPLLMHVTKPWKLHQTSAYEGWRALYRMHGDAMAQLGLFACHIHHEPYPWKQDFAREQNLRYCNDKIAAIGHAGRQHIEPVPMEATGAHIFIGRNIVFNNDEVMRLLGNVEIVPMDQSTDPLQFADMLINKKPASVFFQNPYGKPWLKSVWDVLKAEGVRCICAERGAFPGSIYFDDYFCSESGAYDRVNWSESRPIDTKKFIAGLRASNAALEPQGGENISALHRLIPKGRKRVLVILQSVTDATTNYFTSPLPNYTSFLDTIRELAAHEDLCLLVKNHPLNKISPLEGVGIDVSGYNIYDLYDTSDVCVTLNSGAGLLALGSGVPTIALGKCFYAHQGLALQCEDPINLYEMLKRNLVVDKMSVGKFYSYLINEFYCFADWKYDQRDNGPNAKMSLMSQLEYKNVTISGVGSINARKKMKFSDLSFVPYQLYLFQNKEAFAHEARPSEVTAVLNNVHELVPDYNEDLDALEDDDPALLLHASKLYYDGQFNKSGELFRRYGLRTSDPSAMRYAAEAYFASYDMAEAIECAAFAASRLPDNKRAARRLEELQETPNNLQLISKHAYRIPQPSAISAYAAEM